MLPPGADRSKTAPNVRDLVRRHAATLGDLHASGQRTWGGLPLPLPVYAEGVTFLILRRLHAAGVEQPEGRVGELLQRVAATDLFLSIACDQQVPGAWDRFHESFHPRLLALARRRRLPGITPEEVVADVTGALLAPPALGQARTRIGTYDGTGSLFGWLAAILVRDLVDRCRAASARQQAGRVLELESGLPHGTEPIDEHSPLRAAMDAETAGELRSALHQIWSGLTPQERLVLLLRFRDGVAQTQIARMLALSESRVSRVLAAALDAIRTGLHPRLLALHSVEPARLWRTLHDELGRRLQESPPPADHPAVERLP